MFGFIFNLVFLMVLAVFVYVVVRTIRQNRADDASPRLTVAAKVVAKRQETHYSTDANGFQNWNTSHYATFEVESGDRLELRLDGAAYGQLAEGDFGRLHFQGKRFLDFERVNFN